ncbi:unnamed protein product, partial [marine sediment metagenome]
MRGQGYLKQKNWGKSILQGVRFCVIIFYIFLDIIIFTPMPIKESDNFFQDLEIAYLDDITPYHIEKLKADLLARGLKKSTINGWLQILRGMFYRAIDWEVYSKPNPLKKVRFFKAQRAVQGLSREDLARVLEAAK